MKNYQKNSRNPSVPFSCMFEQLIPADQVKSIKWHLNSHIWSLNLNPWFKPISFNMVASCISSKHIHIAMSWACIILCIALIVFFLVCRYLSPLDRRGFDDEFDDTDEELYYLQKSQASKTPLFIPIQSHSLAPALFYCIRTTTIQLLLAAVAEPLYPLHDLSLPQ